MSSSPTPDAIRTLREKAELTQTDAAALVHNGLRTWQQWELATAVCTLVYGSFSGSRPRSLSAQRRGLINDS